MAPLHCAFRRDLREGFRLNGESHAADARPVWVTDITQPKVAWRWAKCCVPWRSPISPAKKSALQVDAMLPGENQD